MRILTVCTSTKVFGAEVITLKMLEGFKCNGHEQLAVTSIWTDGEFNRRLAEIGVNEARLPFGFFSKRFTFQAIRWTANFAWRLPWLWFRWSRVVREFRPTIILFTSPRLALPVCFLLGGTPAFLIEHENVDSTGVSRKIYAFLAKRLAGIIAVSDSTGENLRQLGVPERRVHVIRNGPFSAADRLAITTTCEGQRAEQALPVVGIVGQISQRKGHEVLLDALQLLRGEGFNFEARVFGSGTPEYVRHLSQRVRACGLENVWKWMGYESERSLIYPFLDVCVVPSSNEPFGMVAAEASAYGKPVIASNIGGLREIVVDGVTGFLVRSGDVEQLASSIRLLSEDRDHAREMGKRGRERVFSEFTQEKMISDFEALFRSFS